MEQFDQSDTSDPFFSPLPRLPPLSPTIVASNALAPPPLATYPSREAIFEAVHTELHYGHNTIPTLHRSRISSPVRGAGYELVIPWYSFELRRERNTTTKSFSPSPPPLRPR
jgi:hypothetical protein